LKVTDKLDPLAGYSIERDSDGDPFLVPPVSVTIFSEPGEGWLVTADYMQGRDWDNDVDVEAACIEYLAELARRGLKIVEI
jgi:hypothetical protein